MKTYLYLSLIPESLIASQLPPDDFGSYYAVGPQNRARGQALFFELDPDFRGGDFKMEDVERRCAPHPDGKPRRSVYLSIYRVLERLPLSALGRLHLVTGDGRVLPLERGALPASGVQEAGDSPERHHLYQEICPVSPRIVSRLDPARFAANITNPDNAVSVDALVFCELALGPLASDPDASDVGHLPYSNIDHLRDCLKELRAKPSKVSKTVNRGLQTDFLYRTVEGGFYVANREGLLHYPMPEPERLERERFAWWRSAQSAFGA